MIMTPKRNNLIRALVQEAIRGKVEVQLVVVKGLPMWSPVAEAKTNIFRFVAQRGGTQIFLFTVADVCNALSMPPQDIEAAYNYLYDQPDPEWSPEEHWRHGQDRRQLVTDLFPFPGIRWLYKWTHVWMDGAEQMKIITELAIHLRHQGDGDLTRASLEGCRDRMNLALPRPLFAALTES